MTQFEIGKSYYYRFACDYDTKVVCKVIKRTAKTITIVDDRHEQKTCRVSVWDDAEVVSPLGRYSMSPILRATRPEIGE